MFNKKDYNKNKNNTVYHSFSEQFADIHTQSMTICPIWATVPLGPVSSVSFIIKSVC